MSSFVPTTNDAPRWLVELLFDTPGWLAGALAIAILVSLSVVAWGLSRVRWDEALARDMAGWLGPPVAMGLATVLVKRTLAPSYGLTVAAGVAAGAVLWLVVGSRAAGVLIDLSELPETPDQRT